MGIYGSERLIHHLPLIQKIGKGVAAPVHIHFIVCDLCNQNCSFCCYRDELYPSNQLFAVVKDGSRNNNPNRMIPAEKVHEILRDAAAMGVRAIQFTGGGEPTVHPQFTSFLTLSAELGLEFAVVSNGVRWSPELLEAAAQATWTRISIDAANPETYCSIRKVSATHFHKACETVRALSLLDGPTVGVGFVVTKENWREIREGVALAKSLGADNVRLSAVFQSEDARYFDGFYEQAAEYCREAKETHDGDGFTVYNNFGSRVADLKQQQPDYPLCGHQHLTTYIGGDQNIYRCCVTAYNNHGLLGSVKDMSFREAWFSPELQSRLNGFDARSCDRCMYNDRNRLINYALSSNPQHVNFV